MSRKSLIPFTLWVGLLVGFAQAAPIPIENFSFELPGTGKLTNFTNVPGWHTDATAADSGVETGYTPSDGTYTAYLRGDPADPALWQLTGHRIVRGDVFELKVEFFIYDGTWYAANSEVLTADFNNEWHHVAGTYDGEQLKVYVDGVLAGSELHKGVIASAAYDVNIGRDAQNASRLYKGLIDDVRIYRGALPKSEIVKLANP